MYLILSLFFLQSCIICKKSESDAPGVKKCKSQDALRNAAERRRSSARDKYVTATQDILASNPSVDLYYHTTCNSQYCAVKRKASNDDKYPQSTSTASTVHLRAQKLICLRQMYEGFCN